MTIVAKSNKTLQDALSTILQKYNLRPHEAIVTMVSTANGTHCTVSCRAGKLVWLYSQRTDDRSRCNLLSFV